MKTYLHIGGLVGVGFDETGCYLLTVSHSGRGVFEVRTWERVARDYSLAYPEAGQCMGIGPIAGQVVAVSENYSTEAMQLKSPDGRITLLCESSGITVL